ncbi:uncharacterized protein MONBRDRAFT_22863 [Monosiga brevicollis MX1]|uniref:Sulfotransferase domain-containing protein n=1 Tax=Monosiga brevicollis TaxID=81824 RepID=A9USA6_MONBE|nr:uncharacterized protein MONBRDRAFT_22863 [Monosiga brevicollis MX1]EDQ92066.1 predicted protein [Monosiga brevicollis MX1]|eukprot:XP_001743352.1 hypothetical protein [Monosiga brevicollis MX1]
MASAWGVAALSGLRRHAPRALLAFLLLLTLASLWLLQPTGENERLEGRRGHVDYGLPPLEHELNSSAQLQGVPAFVWEIPQLLIIGVMKAGTSALYYALCEHPRINCVAYVKEPFYLSSAEVAAQAREYHGLVQQERRRLFHLRYVQTVFNLTALSAGQVTLEASTTYLHSAAALTLITSRLMNADRIRMLVVLREPLSRALSHYNHEKRHGKQKATFGDAIAPELAILKSCHQQDTWLAQQNRLDEARPYEALYDCVQAESERYRLAKRRALPGYLFKSLYLWHLRPWLAAVPDRLHFVLHEHFRRDPITELAQLQRNIGLEEFDYESVREEITHEFQEGSRYNRFSGPMIHELALLFRAHNDLLELAIGMPLPWNEALERGHFVIPIE